MTTKQLVDSAAPVPPAAAVAAGIAGVIRYVSQEAGKNLTPAESSGYHAANLTVNAVYEDGTTDYEGGATSGSQHGAVAKQLLDAMGYPDDRALIVAVDTDIQPSQYQLGLAYVQETASTSGRRAGVYGPDGFVRYCMAHGVPYGMNAAGWSDGASNSAQIQQGFPTLEVGGTQCDPDEAGAADYGQWPYDPPKPPDPPSVPPPAAPYVAAVAVAGATGDAWFLRPDGEVDGRDVAGKSAASYGGLAGKPLDKAPIGIASAPTGKGYWVVAEDGGVFAFGDATFHGSTAGTHLNKPIVALVPSPTGGGYALVGADGGFFAFGDVKFEGSVAAEKLNAPVVAASGTPSGAGYWALASDGGVFALGDATFHGSAVQHGAARAVGVAACGAGYVVARADGSVVAFGTAAHGDYPALPPAEREGTRRFAAIAGTPAGAYTLLGSDGSQYHFG